MELIAFLADIGSFAFKALVIAALLGLLILLTASMVRQSGHRDLGTLSVTSLNRHYQGMHQLLESVASGKKARKRRAKQKSADQGIRKRVYVIEFEGDLAAAAVGQLRQQVNALVPVIGETDEVVVLVESNGGLMSHYGLAAAQLARFRKKGVPLTVCVDKVAASGGYMMACVADKIIAAPFAIVGSVGVMVMFPNFHRLLEKYQIDYMELTAGEYKRTISPLGEITDKGKKKFLEELEDAHRVFKDFIAEHRPGLEMEKIATGEAWNGVQALPLKLVDELKTSDEYLLALSEEADLFRVDYEIPKSLKEKLAGAVTESADQLLLRWRERLERGSGPRA